MKNQGNLREFAKLPREFLKTKKISGNSITMKSQWVGWRLKSPASPLFTQPFIRAQIKENIKAPRHWPLCGEFTGDHDDVIKWKYFPRYWPFVRGIHRSPVNSPHKGQRGGALMFFFDLCLNKRLSKQSWGWWFETLSHPLWRHCNVNCIPFYKVHISRFYFFTEMKIRRNKPFCLITIW